MAMEAYASTPKPNTLISPSTVKMPKDDEDLDRLCDYCKEISKILGSNSSEVVEVRHHKTYQAFLKAAEGCPLCHLIVQSLTKYRDGIVGIQCSCSQELKIRVQYFQGWQSNAPVAPLQEDLHFELFRTRDNAANSRHEIFGRSIFEDPAEAVTSVALPWITDCQNSHVKCHQVEQGNQPTRVLDVGKEGDHVFLRESRDISERYTVLSHCWGTERALTTTAPSIEQHMKVIPYPRLPATFQDAVRITRLLGIKYLWIDSLCIIQDQLSDWEHESAKMHEYYRNAFVTIAALDSRNSFSGMLHWREVPSVQLPGLENLVLRAKIPTARSIYENSILESRAWCLQERMLSTRVIHMAKSEVLFECRTGHQRESSVQIGDSVATEGFYRFGPDRLKRVLDNLESDPKSAEKAPEFWYNLVQQYSRRDLTNPGDMLPAILGVAEQIKKYTGLTYMHGLWKEDLARGLLWTNDWRSHSKVSEEARQQTGEPSWSWAAMTGYIKYWPKIQPSLLLDCKLDWNVARSSDRELILRCRCFYVYLQGSKPHPFRASMQHWDTANIFHVYYNESHNPRRYTDRVRGARVGWMIADVEINPANLNQCKAVEIIGADLKHLDETKGEGDKDTAEYTIVPAKVWFLVVVPHPDTVGCWKRVGIGMSGDASYQFDDAYLVEAIKPELIFEGGDVESIYLR
ncbi:HET-domain-containing protein [Cadophora sp. DSE1049]|nr:HET-domain-containing protein [Cadophora sp. DSE1049]